MRMGNSVRWGVRWAVASSTAVLCTALASAQSPPAKDPAPAGPSKEAPARPPKAAPKKKADPKKNADEIERLVKETGEQMAKGDFAAAEPGTRTLVELDPENFVHVYNLACIRSRQRDAKEAIDLLAQAVELGFTDLRHVQRDPDLADIRQEAGYKAILADWDALLAKSGERNLRQVREFFSNKNYKVERDERLRMIFVGAIDERAFDEVRAEMGALADWAAKHVFPDLHDAQQLRRDAWVVVVLPNRPDFKRWSFKTFGNAADNGLSMIGGSYQHDQKRLVSQDLGGSLRHEFFHALHWRDCTRRGQFHAMWVQEGLCSLVEDYDVGPEGVLIPAPSWRTNTVQRMLTAGTFIPLKRVLATSHQDFLGSQRMGLYAISRSIFLYLSQRGKLRAWYEAYAGGLREDRTGQAALEKVLDMPLADIEKDFRQWVKGLPTVAEELRPGMASLGVEVENGEGDGPKIVAVGRASPFSPHDVITRVNTRPTRDLPELLRVLGMYRPHDIVPVTVRRGKMYKDLEVTLGAVGGR